MVLLAVEDQTAELSAEERYQALLGTIGEGAVVMDAGGVFRACSRRGAQILGRPVRAVVGSRFNDPQWTGLRPDGTPLRNESFPFWRARYTGEPVRGEVMGLYPPDGPPRWLRVNAQPLFWDGDDEPHAVLATFTDVTDERLRDEALQASRELLSSVLASSLNGIMVFAAVRDPDQATDAQPDGPVVDFEWLLVNPQAERLMGVASDDLVGARLLKAMPENRAAGLFDAYVDVVRTGQPLDREVRYRHQHIDAWFQVVAVKIDDGLAVSFNDVTERKEAAEMMAAANAKLEQRNRALRDFAYIASHDLQEPLRKISAFSNLMREDYARVLDETGAYYLDRMQDAARRMSQLISDLLVYSRVTTQAQPFEQVDLQALAETVRTDLELQAEDVGGRVEIGALPSLEADPTQMRQLLQNLVGNGLKFHREDVPPVVRVTAAGPSDDPAVVGETAFAGEAVALAVEDNGIGFEAKYADRIFSPFKRLHGRGTYAGTGMGLAICRRIAERHGGTIRADSTPGEGTTFRIVLPARQHGDDARADAVPSALAPDDEAPS